MSGDIRDLLRDAVDPLVGAGVDFDAVLDRSRELRRTRRALFIATCALGAGALAGILWLAAAIGFPFLHPVPPAATASASTPSSFPGGSQVLYEQGGALRWASPNGASHLIARNFSGARPFPENGSGLLAWKATGDGYDYYVMDGDGSHRVHVLAPGETRSDIPDSYLDVVISPDGSKLAYLHPRPGNAAPTRARYELEVKNITTGKVTDLGPAGPFSNCCYHLTWSDDSVLLMQSGDGRFIGWVNISSDTRGIYVRVNDSRILKAYGQAWPGAGPPKEISPIGESPDPYVSDLAVLVSGAEDTKQAVVVLTNHGVHGFAPHDGDLQLSFTWGPLGDRFALLSYHSPARGGRSGDLYLGKPSRYRLMRLQQVTGLIAGPLFNYDASVILIDEQQRWQFISLGANPLCSAPVSCNAQVRSVFPSSSPRGLPWAWG